MVGEASKIEKNNIKRFSIPSPATSRKKVFKMKCFDYGFTKDGGMLPGGQGSMLQTPMAEASPWQVSWEVLRLLSLMPPPQDLEQLVHVSHVDHSQSTKKKIKSMND